MLIAGSQKYIYTAENDLLKTYNAEDLVQFSQTTLDGPISSLCCDSIVISGTRNGSLYTVASEKPRILKQFKSPVSALFLKGTILGVGTDCGVICVMLIRDTELVVLEEREHTAPVLGIVTDGVTTYISDMQNRICMFPNQKVYDNFNTHIYYSKYLFASESIFLYCKTKEAFAVCLEHTTGNEIQRFMFSKTGSVLLVKEKNKVCVYDFNRREMINEIEVTGEFTYDDDRNRLIVAEGRMLTTIDNVADRDLLRVSMNDVFFKESKIEERIVWSESECSDEILSIKRKKKKNVCYKFVKKDSDAESSDTSVASRDDREKGMHRSRDLYTEPRSERKKTLDVLFEDSTSTEQQKHILHAHSAQQEGISVCPMDIQCEVPLKREPFMSSSVKCSGSHLMCYNTLGYLISTKDEFFSLVELRYHDSSRSGMKIKDTNFCTLGVFSGSSVLLATEESLHFYSENIEWTHKSSEEIALIGISKAVLGVVYCKGILRIYKHSGLELFNCEFEAVDCICCHGQYVVVLCDKLLYRVNSETFTCEKSEILGGANWIHVDEHIHYRVENRVYVLSNGLSLKVAKLDNVPLCVSNGYLLALSNNIRLYPEPSVEYFKMRLEHNSSCPNVLNFVVFGREEDQLTNIAKDAEEQGRTRLAKDVRSLLKGIGEVVQQKCDVEGTDGADEDGPVHYREKENIKWTRLDNSGEVSQDGNRSAMFGEIKTKKYSPFKR